jgi:hypothetical protein
MRNNNKSGPSTWKGHFSGPSLSAINSDKFSYPALMTQANTRTGSLPDNAAKAVDAQKQAAKPGRTLPSLPTNEYNAPDTSVPAYSSIWYTKRTAIDTRLFRKIKKRQVETRELTHCTFDCQHEFGCQHKTTSGIDAILHC